jgi:cyclophilin family peptidyl-prolyl cis-trans isomerase
MNDEDVKTERLFQAKCGRILMLGVALALSICDLGCVSADSGGATGPADASDLAVVGTIETEAIVEGAPIELTASATGGDPPYLFRWDQNGGPDTVELSDVTSAALTINGIVEPGRYVFRIIVTDSAGFHAEDYVSVELPNALIVDVPAFAVVGEPVELSVEVNEQPNGTTLLWEVTSGGGSFDDATSTMSLFTAESSGTIDLRLTATIPLGGTGATVVREFEVASAPNETPRVLIATNFGDFTLELDGATAPLHTANFLLYTDDRFFDGLLFHRNACADSAETGECEPFVLQGGGYEREGEELVAVEATRDPIASEADNGRTNSELYSVSLALRGGDTGSGTTQFFINLDDNGFLDDLGFTVFATVVSGTDVVDSIAAMPAEDSSIIPGEVSLPVEDVIIERITRIVP